MRKAGVTPNRDSMNGVACLQPTHAFELNTRLPSPTGWRQGGCRPLPSKAVLDCTFAETVWHKAIASVPELASILWSDRTTRSPTSFVRLEARRRRTTVQIVCGRHADKIPRGNYGAMNVIRSEIKRKRGHMPHSKTVQGDWRDPATHQAGVPDEPDLGRSIPTARLGRVRPSRD